MHLDTLVGQREGTDHTGYAATDHQCRTLNRVRFSGKRHQHTRFGGGHTNQISGFSSGSLFISHVDPGTVFPDVGHFKKKGVQARLSEGILENRFMGSGGAGSNDHPVEVFFFDGFNHPLDGIDGAAEGVFLGVNNPPQGLSVCHHIGRRHAFNDIGTAVAHKHTDPWGFPPDIPFLGVEFFTDQ